MDGLRLYEARGLELLRLSDSISAMNARTFINSHLCAVDVDAMFPLKSEQAVPLNALTKSGKKKEGSKAWH